LAYAKAAEKRAQLRAIKDDLPPRVPAKRKRLIPRRRPQHEVLAALKQTHGFIQPASELLGVSRSALRQQISSESRLAAARHELTEGVLDTVEKSVVDKAVQDGNLRAAQLFLSARGRSRGYGNPTGAETVVEGGGIRDIIFTVVPRGRYLLKIGATDPTEYCLTGPQVALVQKGETNIALISELGDREPPTIDNLPEGIELRGDQ
jgi:hypothetical protein